MTHAYKLDQENGESVGIMVNRIFKMSIEDSHARLLSNYTHTHIHKYIYPLKVVD